MALNTVFFQYFSDCLAENNKLIRMEKEKKSSPHPVKKKKILLELEITEEEYGHFMNHILKAGQNPGSAQEPILLIGKFDPTIHPGDYFSLRRIYSISTPIESGRYFPSL